MLILALLQADAAAFDPTPLLKVVLEGIEKGQWWIALGPALALGIFYAKKLIAPRWPKLGEFLNKPVVAFSTPFVLSFLGGMGNTLATTGVPGKEQFIALLSSAIKVAVTAIASYVGVKKLAEQKAAAEVTAVAAVPDKQAAIDELNKGGK
jgi:hypothetical protein